MPPGAGTLPPGLPMTSAPPPGMIPGLPNPLAAGKIPILELSSLTRPRNEVHYNYHARYIPFFNVRQYTQINVHLIKEYGIVPIAYGCTEIRSQNKGLN